MKIKKECDRQLKISFEFDSNRIFDDKENTISIKDIERPSSCTKIKFNSYQTQTERKLIERFYSLSDHLD